MQKPGDGGPPRANAGRWPLAGCRAGSEVGSAPWQFFELPSLSCFALQALGGAAMQGDAQGTKKQGAGWLALAAIFLMPQKSDCTPKFYDFWVFLIKKVTSAPLVRMRSPVQIWSAAPRKVLKSKGFRTFLHILIAICCK